MNLKDSSVKALQREISRARSKFPNNKKMFLALSEEVGELAKDMLEEKNSWREEALQVACVAMRIYEEGDASHPKTVEFIEDIIPEDYDPDSNFMGSLREKWEERE